MLTDEVNYVSADEEDKFYIASWDAPLKGDTFKNELVIAKYNRQFTLVARNKIQYMGVSPKQIVGISLKKVGGAASWKEVNVSGKFFKKLPV